MKNLYTDFSSKYVVILCMTTLILLMSLELFLRHYIVTIPKSTPNIVKRAYDSESKVIVIGDSHFYRGFVNSEDVINLSKGGYTIPVVYEILKQISDKRGKQIIFEASPQLFSKRHLEWGIRGFDKYFVLPSMFKVFIFEPGVTQYLRSITGLPQLKTVLTKNWPNDKIKKSSWELIDQKQKSLLTKSRVNLHRPLLNTTQAMLYQLVLEEMVTYALNQGMTVCFLRTPVDDNYQEMISNHPDYIEANRIFRDLASEKGVKYVDFRELDMSFGFEKFINQDHLTPSASKEFVPLVLSSCGF